MGRTSRWFRAFWGAKKSPDSSTTLEHSRPDTREKKKWGFVRSLNGNGRSNCGTRGNWYAGASSSGPYADSVDANKHAIAVAAATAAVAEAALAAAHAAAEVVRLTSCGGSRPHPICYYSGSDRRRELAAVKIQSAFRAYLARRALRALKGLVRLQALVRGHIVRKQSADMLRRMQALARIQARACANRAQMPSHSTSKSSQTYKPGFATIENDTQLRSYIAKSDRAPILKKSQSKTKLKDTVDLERICLGSNWLDQWMEECSWNSQGDTSQKAGRAEDERSDKILEVDTWKPHLNSKPGDGNFRTPQHVTPRNYNNLGVTLFNPLSDHSPKPQKKNQSISYNDPLSLSSLKFPVEVDQIVGWAGDNSPQVYSSSSKPGSSGRRGPFTPARSECSRSFFSDYVGYPNYMANTESSLARVRSQSAPRQRMQQYEKLGSTKRFGGGLWDTEAISERGSVVHSNLSTKAHLGSGCLDGHGMPVQGNSTASYNSRYSARG